MLAGQTGYSKVRLFRKFPLSSNTIIMTIYIVQQEIYFIFFGTKTVWEHSLAYNVKHSCQFFTFFLVLHSVFIYPSYTYGMMKTYPKLIVSSVMT